MAHPATRPRRTARRSRPCSRATGSAARPATGADPTAGWRDSIVWRPRIGHRSIPSALLGLLCVALLLRLPNLTESLWLDELWATRVMLVDLPTLWTTILLDPHPPVYSGFMFVWITLFGDSELSIRLPSLIFGVVSVGLTYLVGTRYVSRTATVLACLLLALSPVHIWYSQEARPYSAAVCLVLLAVFAYHKLEESPRSALWSTVYFGSMWSAVLTHLYLTAYLALISAICLRSGRVKTRVLSMNLVIALSLASFLFVKHLLLASPPTTELNHLRTFTPPELWMLFFNWFSFGNAIWSLSPYSHLRGLVQSPAVVILQIIFAVVFAQGLVRVWRESRHWIELLAYCPSSTWGWPRASPGSGAPG
jgi:4-amino-4-deoxy-L-arabinose transferase-like glycosyltransferase